MLLFVLVGLAKDEKNSGEPIGINKEISSGVAFATTVEEDPTK